MTTPGPQQPDEVRPCCRSGDLTCRNWRNCPRFRPVAPSAQPDEVCMCSKPESDEVHGAPEPNGGHAYLPASGHPAARDTAEGR